MNNIIYIPSWFLILQSFTLFIFSMIAMIKWWGKTVKFNWIFFIDFMFISVALGAFFHFIDSSSSGCFLDHDYLELYVRSIFSLILLGLTLIPIFSLFKGIVGKPNE